MAVIEGGEKNKMGQAIKGNVQKLLDARGWTIYRLSKESGIPMTVLYSLGEKSMGPTADTLLKLSNALGVTIDEIVKGRADF